MAREKAELTIDLRGVEAFSSLLSERDANEERIEEFAKLIGCEKEWSNLHSHWDCVEEFIRRELEAKDGE